MARPTAASIAAACCLLGTSCEGVLGTVDVAPPPLSAEQTPAPEGGGAPVQPAESALPAPPREDLVGLPGGEPPVTGMELPLLDAGGPPSSGEQTVDASAPSPSVRPVIVDGALIELERVGVDGGQPRLGVCQNGVVVGVRPTANPSEGVFGQRLTFIEPLCGTVSDLPLASLTDPANAAVAVIRDASAIAWSTSGGFQGTPPTELPDPQLIWAALPAIVCPDTAPVLVGLSGDYDPSVLDQPDTAAFRSLVIECAPLELASDGIDVVAAASGHQFVEHVDRFAAIGSDTYRSSCPAGAVITQLQIHSGYWLDGFVLGCSVLRSPRLAGEPCSVGRQCQSGACLPEGACSR